MNVVMWMLAQSMIVKERDISTDVEVLSESEYEEEAGQNVTISSIGLPNWTTTQYGVAELEFTGPSGVNGDIVKGNDPLYLQGGGGGVLNLRNTSGLTLFGMKFTPTIPFSEKCKISTLGTFSNFVKIRQNHPFLHALACM